jgi:AraC family transcriptional regulator
MRLNRALDFINDNLSEELRLEALAGVAGFSPFHFHRIFSSIVGESPRDYIERLRLERAANFLLMHPGKTITEIALDCGFSSHAAFARSFKRRYGVPASGYLDHHAAVAHVPEIRETRHEIDPSFSVGIVRLPSYRLAYARSSSGYEKGVCAAWRKMMKFAMPRNLIRDETVYIGISHDNPAVTSKDRCRYYACISVSADVHPAGDIGIMDLEAATYAVYHYRGTAAGIPEVYRVLYRDWFAESGYIPDDKPPIEIYPPDMMSGCAADFFRYDIAIPVKALR